jgi:hypothetical protein
MRLCSGNALGSVLESKDSPSSLPFLIRKILPSRCRLLSPCAQQETHDMTMRFLHPSRYATIHLASWRRPGSDLVGMLVRQHIVAPPQSLPFVASHLSFQSMFQEPLAQSCLPACSAVAQIGSSSGFLVRLVQFYRAAGQAHDSEQLSGSTNLAACNTGPLRNMLAMRLTAFPRHRLLGVLVRSDTGGPGSLSSQPCRPTLPGGARASLPSWRSPRPSSHRRPAS